MKENGDKRFSLGDILQKLNEARAASAEKTTPETIPAAPAETPAPTRRRERIIEGKPDPAFEPDNLMSQPRFDRNGTFSAPMTPQASPAQMPAASAVTPPVPASSITNYRPAPPSDPLSPVPPAEPQNPEIGENAPFDLMQYVGVVVRRKNIVLLSIFIATIICLVAYMHSVKYYSAHARMLFSPGFQDIMNENAAAGSFTRDEQKLNTHLELLKSETLLKRVCKNIDNKLSVGTIQAGLKVTRGLFNGEKNDIVDIFFRHTSPELSQEVVNQICREYIDYMREVSVQDLTNLIAKLDGEISSKQEELAGKEGALRDFREKNRSVELSQETNVTVSKLSGMELAEQQTELEMAESKNRLSQIRKQIDQQEINVIQSMTYNNPYQARLSELELQLNSALAEYSPEHFKVRMIKNEIEKIKSALKTDVTNEAASRTLTKNPIRESLLQEVINLSIEGSANDTKKSAQEKLIKDYDSELAKLPAVQLEYAQLVRETEALIGIVKLLKNRFEEAKIKRDSQESDLKILEWAPLPAKGESSMKLVNVLVGLLIGIVVGVVLAFLLEFLDQSIKDPQHVERGLEVPLLGIVPLIEMEKAIIDSSAAKWRTILEPFRALRATLKHLATTRNIKTFIICSAVKGEGKTTLAANISITFALDGKKIILVDGDLRRAQMHSLFNLPKKMGLSDYLLGTADVEDILKKTVHENLFVITAGDHPQNPAELIGSPRFDLLVKTLRGMADYVIFDSPALLPVSDGLSMAPKIEVCIMIVRALWTPMKAAMQAKSQLKRIGIPVVGAVLNGISHSRGYYPYYYGYYRYYTYQYSYEEDQDQGKTFSLREFGLRAELRIRDSIQTFFFSLPRYFAASLSLARHLLRRKTFWFLLCIFLAVPLLPLGLKMFGISIPHRDISFLGEKPDIRYLADHGAATDVSGSSLEAIATGQKASPGDTGAFISAPTESSSHKDGAIADSGLFHAIADSIYLWQSAFNEKNLSRYLSFYDSIRFKSPGGGYALWASSARDELRPSGVAHNLRIDSSWIEPIVSPYYQITFSGLYSSPEDSSHREYSIVWQQTDNRWRIVREKYKELP